MREAIMYGTGAGFFLAGTIYCVLPPSRDDQTACIWFIASLVFTLTAIAKWPALGCAA